MWIAVMYLEWSEWHYHRPHRLVFLNCGHAGRQTMTRRRAALSIASHIKRLSFGNFAGALKQA
jgi:hypothetical protein